VIGLCLCHPNNADAGFLGYLWAVGWVIYGLLNIDSLLFIDHGHGKPESVA